MELKNIETEGQAMNDSFPTTLSELGLGNWFEVPEDLDIPTEVTYAEVHTPTTTIGSVTIFCHGRGRLADSRGAKEQGYTYWTPVLIESPIDWQKWVDEVKRSGCGIEVGGMYLQTADRWRRSLEAPMWNG